MSQTEYRTAISFESPLGTEDLNIRVSSALREYTGGQVERLSTGYISGVWVTRITLRLSRVASTLLLIDPALFRVMSGLERFVKTKQISNLKVERGYEEIV